jgi:CHAT domain-containing protein/tetratricopeptide (TPR) repeat protein
MRAKGVRLLIGFAALVIAGGAVWLSLDWIGGLAFQRGLQAKNDWNLAQAVNYLTWAQRLQRSKAVATLELGVCEQLRGDFLTSQKHLEGLLKTKVDDPATLSHLHNAIGINHYSFNQPEAAFAAHQQALEFAKRSLDRRLEAEALIGLSRVLYHSKGKFDEAVANLELALSIGKEIPDERIQAASLRNLGVLYWWFKGELDRPLNEFYFPALELYRRQNDQRGAATMLTLIALVFNNKGDIYSFMRYQNESIEIQERIGDQAGLSDSYMTLGILYNGTGNYRKARDFFARGLAITLRTGYALAQNDLNALLADVQVNLEDYDEALKLYDPTSKHKQDPSGLSNYVLQYIAHCYQLKGDYQQALSLYEQALQIHQQAGQPDVRFRANTLLRVAECSIALGDWQKAAEFWAMAKEMFESGETHSEGAMRPALVAAALARHEGRHEQSLKELRHALDVEEQIFASAKTNLLIPPHRRSYEMLYGFLLDYSGSTNNPALSQRANEILFGVLENMRYRSLRNFLVQIKEKRIVRAPADERERVLGEQIKKLSENLKRSDDDATRAQLRKTYHEYEEVTLKVQLQQPQYAAISSAKPIALAELRQTLPADTALVEFLIVGERVCALAITQKNVRAFELPVSKQTLAAKTKLFRSLVFADDPDESVWLPVAASLRSSLIEPLEAAGVVVNIKTLGVVPYGLLHDLPFAALTRSEDGGEKFLIEDYSLFQTPSATFFARKGRTPVSEPKATTTIAFGRNRSSDPSLPNLAFAADEALAVAQTTGGQAYVNQKATETEVKRLAYECDYLHLSTHGVAESEMPLFSRLLLEPTATDDGKLTVREIFELGLRTELVTLSACETGQSFSASGTDLVEQDRVGLIEAFLHAGSRGVLATLLPVSDRPTMAFMNYFYGQLANRKSGMEALANTQRAMLRGDLAPPSESANAKPQSYRHPRYWAPFILVGNSH